MTEVSFDYFSPTKPKYYRLPETTALKELQLNHEHLIGQLYVALEVSGILQWWEMKQIPEYKLKPDAASIINGLVIFWEIDTGSEDYAVIKSKIERYLKMSQENPEQRFNVCFTTNTQFDRVGKIKRTAQARAKGVLNLINDYQRADQFLVTTHDYALKYLDKEAFCSHKNPMGISLLDLK